MAKEPTEPYLRELRAKGQEIIDTLLVLTDAGRLAWHLDGATGCYRSDADENGMTFRLHHAGPVAVLCLAALPCVWWGKGLDRLYLQVHMHVMAQEAARNHPPLLDLALATVREWSDRARANEG